MFKCVVFDMDGTLVDSYEGIFNAYRWTMGQMGRPFLGDAFVRRAIGAPLPWVFEELGGMDRKETARAVHHYRAYYADRGRHELRVYDGMEEALRRLKAAGRFLGVATLKKEAFARDILEECGLLPFFDAVYGMDEGDTLTKAALIDKCRRDADAAPGETVLVGDTPFDAQGAAEAGTAFLAVTYGFGFRDAAAARSGGAAMTAASPQEAAGLLCGI